MEAVHSGAIVTVADAFTQALAGPRGYIRKHQSGDARRRSTALDGVERAARRPVVLGLAVAAARRALLPRVPLARVLAPVLLTRVRLACVVVPVRLALVRLRRRVIVRVALVVVARVMVTRIALVLLPRVVLLLQPLGPRRTRPAS